MWHTRQICTIPKYTKREYTISSGTEKRMNSQTPGSTLHFDEWIRSFIHKGTVKLSKNKMDSKVAKSQQLSMKKSHAVSV